MTAMCKCAFLPAEGRSCPEIPYWARAGALTSPFSAPLSQPSQRSPPSSWAGKSEDRRGVTECARACWCWDAGHLSGSATLPSWADALGLARRPL